MDLSDLGDPHDRANWPAYRARLAELFATRTRDEWAAMFDGPDDTVMPVLDLEEAPQPPPERRAGRVRASSTAPCSPRPRRGSAAPPSELRRVGPRPGEGGDEALAEWGFTAEDVARLRQAGAIG